MPASDHADGTVPSGTRDETETAEVSKAPAAKVSIPPTYDALLTYQTCERDATMHLCR